jgi:tetratricopeptide (TPR) repeat protein
MRTTGSRRRTQGAILLAVLLAIPVPGRCAVAPSPTGELRARAARALADLEQSTQDVGKPFDRLAVELAAVAADLEAAKLDSLASDLRCGTAKALLRAGKPDPAEEQYHLATAAALRAGDPAREIEARIGLLDGRLPKHTTQSRDGVNELLPRIETLGRDDLRASAHLTLARAADLLGDFETSLAEAKRTLGYAASAGDRNLVLRAMSQCGAELRLLHRNAESLVYTDSVITVARRLGLQAPLARSLFDRASILRQDEKFDAALAAIDEAIAIDHRRDERSLEMTATLLRANVLFHMQRYDQCAETTRGLLGWSTVRDLPVTWARLEEMYGRALNAAGRPADAETLFAHFMPEMERFRAGLPTDRERASLGVHVYNNYAAWTRARVQLGRAGDAWEIGERGHAIALEGRLGLTGTPDLAALQSHLRAHSAAYVAWDVPDPLMGNVVVVTPDTVAAFRLRGDGVSGDDLESVMDRARADQALPPAPEAAARMSEALLVDVWPVIRGRVRHLYVVPPALLEMVPFEALPPPGGGAPLGETMGVSYVPSAVVLMGLEARPAPASGLVVFADPAVDAGSAPIAGLEATLRGSLVAPLPGARAEAERMHALGAEVYTGRNATADRVRRSRGNAVLHFATHAVDSHGRSNQGGLVLAGPDPMLSPAEVESLHVASDLVTLAACGTLGAYSDLGEGPRGLARAFLVSGARSVVTTRWEVSDRAAARFMTEFYARLRAGETRARALSIARQALVSGGFPPRDAWAFTLTGIGDEPVPALAGRGKSGRLAK